MKRCDQEERLTPFLLGDLPGPEADAVRRHLTQCAACQTTVRHLEPTLALLRSALARDAAANPQLAPARRARLLAVRPQSRARIIRWVSRPMPWLAAAAGLIVLAGVTTKLCSFSSKTAEATSRIANDEMAKAAQKCVDAETIGADRYYGTAPRPTTPACQPAPSPAQLSDKSDFSLKGNGIMAGNASRELGERSKSGQAVRTDARPEPVVTESVPAARVAQAGTAKRSTHGLSRLLVDADGDGGIDVDAKGARDENGRRELLAGDTLTLGDDRRQAGVGSRKPAAGEAADAYAAGLEGTVTVGGEVAKSLPTASSGNRAGGQAWYARNLEPAPDTTREANAPVAASGPEPTSRLDSAPAERLYTSTPSLPADVPAAAPATPAPTPARQRKVAADELDGRDVAGQRTSDQLEKKAELAQKSSGERSRDAEQGTSSLYFDRVAPANPLSEHETRRRMQETVIPEIDFRGANMPDEDAGKLRVANTSESLAAFEDTLEELNASAKPTAPRVPAAFNPFVATAVERFSTFSIDVDTASYTLTRQAIQSGRLPEPEVVRTEEIVNAFDYGDVAPDRATFRVYVEGAPSPFGPDLALLRIGVKGRRLGREEQRPAMLTFLIDTSGSMSQPDRIGLARTSLKLLLENLAPADRIQIVAYDDRARVVLDPTPATQAATVLAAFDSLQCTGSTNLEDGMRKAYELAARAFVPGAENRVILVSDGVANLGTGDAAEILSQIAAFRRQGITCSVFGVGKGTYNDQMLEQLANKGDGVYRFLDSEEEARRAFVDDLAATLNTIAADVKIQVEWNPAAVRCYRQLGYENRALTKEQFRDDTVDAGEVGSGQSVTALYEVDPDTASAARRRPLGTVRIRYRRTDTRAIEEIESPILPEMIAANIDASRPQFKLAAGAAEFAEILRASPYAAGSRFEDVARLLRPVALALPLDTRVKELLDLAGQAEAMSK